MQHIGEYYHVYNRGAHKAPIFHDRSDYERFVSLLYIANNPQPLIHPFWNKDIFSQTRQETLVHIFCYCLMPNHFHIGIQEKQELGIEHFMRKLCTAYVMYYNLKYKHSGTIFQGKYKSKRVTDDYYLMTLIEYIHLNPFGIEETDIMKSARPEYLREAIAYSKDYEFSSFKDYLGTNRPQGKLLHNEINHL